MDSGDSIDKLIWTILKTVYKNVFWVSKINGSLRRFFYAHKTCFYSKNWQKKSFLRVLYFYVYRPMFRTT